MKLLIVCASLAASACAMNGARDTSQKADAVSGTYTVSQLTAGTWTASTSANVKTMTLETRAKLLAHIEKISGCRVTDSDVRREGAQLDAQVDCDSRMKN